MASRKTFRSWNPQEYAHRSFTPAEVLGDDDLVFFLLDVAPQLDLSAIYGHYERETRGAPPYDVAMMVTLLVYSYCVGVFSSRKIAAACERNLAFLAIVGDQRPDFRTISDFRKIHLQALADLFVQVLQIAGAAGMIKLGNLALDGSKFRANASRHKAMSYGYMEQEVVRLRAEIAALLQQAEQADAEQDATLGSRRGDELPEELKRRQDRLQAIEAAMQRLEAQAKERAEAKRREREQAQAEQEPSGSPGRGRPRKPIADTPEEKAQTNFTDPEAKIMKTSNKGFDYCYNSQVVVDEEHQIIVAAEVTPQANDKQQAIPMAEAALANLEAVGLVCPQPADESDAPVPPIPPIPMSADTGYFSEENVIGLEKQNIDPHIAIGREKHHAPTPAKAQEASAPQATAQEGRDPQPQTATLGDASAPQATAQEARDGQPQAATLGQAAAPQAQATAKERMAQKLRTPAGKARYAKRKHIVEPVFGQIKHARGFRQFLLRGLSNVGAEWKLVCLTHNLLKIWRYQCALG